jgi:hypothetical protein
VAEYCWRIEVAVWRRGDADMAAPSLQLWDLTGRLGSVVYEDHAGPAGWSAYALPRDGVFRAGQRDYSEKGRPLFGRRNLYEGETKRPADTLRGALLALLELLKAEVPKAEREALVKVADFLLPTLQAVVDAHVRRYPAKTVT